MDPKKKKIQLTVLGGDDVRAAAPTVARAADLIEHAFEIAAIGDVDQPEKPYVRPGGKAQERERGRLITMPAYIGGDVDVLGLKAITSQITNPRLRGLPRAAAVTIVFDPESGLPMAIMEGAYLSALRTGATALFALRHLLPPGQVRAALLGAGVIARQTAAGLAELDALECLTVYDVHVESAQGLAMWARDELGLTVRVAENAEEAVRGANAVVAATTAPGPYLRPEWFGAGCVYVALSLVDADPEFMIQADHLVVDDWRQACREGKPLEHMARAGLVHEADTVTFAELASGRVVRRSPEDRIYVNPMGVAIEDLVVARATLERAVELGLGTRIDWL